MGYLVEEAFRDRLKVFDFVAGIGKQGQYKKHITQHRRQMVTLQFVRARWLKRAYAMYNRLAPWLHRYKTRNKKALEAASDT